MQNHLTGSSLQPRGLVALFSALGLFQVSWQEIEEIFIDLKNEKISKNNMDFSINPTAQYSGSGSELGPEPGSDSGVGSGSGSGSDSSIGSGSGSGSSLALSFSRAAERCLPELSHAEIFQVCVCVCVCVCECRWVLGCVCV